MTTPKAAALDALTQIQKALDSPEPLTGLRLRLLRETVDYARDCVEGIDELRWKRRKDKTP
jgi:hypothetical protein